MPLSLIRKAATLARTDETRDFSIEERAARRKWKTAPIFCNPIAKTQLLKLKHEKHCLL
jgi:hypothetical protein